MGSVPFQNVDPQGYVILKAMCIWHNCSLLEETSTNSSFKQVIFSVAIQWQEYINTPQYTQCDTHTLVETAPSRPWSAENRATECSSRCYAAQWPCQSLCCLSMVFSIFVDDVRFWLWKRLERICWITLSFSGFQNPHSASLPCCNSVFYLMLPAEREEGYI